MSELFYWIEQIFNGISQGSIYALIVIGYTLIVGIVGLPSFAYGDIVMCGAYFAYLVFSSVGNNALLVFLCAFAGTALLGIIMHKLCYEPFFDSPRHISLMCTIGMSILIKNVVQLLTKSVTMDIPSMFGTWYFDIGTIRITAAQVCVLGIVIILSSAFTLFLKKTKLGIQLRAVSQDRKAASLVGVDVNAIILFGNAIGCGMGGLAGLLYAVYYNSFRATMGGAIGMKAFSSAVLGGLGDISVASICGLIIGILENIGIALTSTGYRDMVAFIFLIVVLMFNPTGLGGKKKKIRLSDPTAKKGGKRH